MVKTIDGKNDLWPRSQSGSVDCFASQVFYLAGTAPKIQSGILKLGYGASLKNLEVLETPGQQPCIALSEVQEQLLCQTGGAFRAPQPHLAGFTYVPHLPGPHGHLGLGTPDDVIKVTDQGPPGKTNVCGGWGAGGSAFYRHRKQSFILMLLEK